MVRTFLFKATFLALFLFQFSYSQDYKSIDAKVDLYPKDFKNSTQLADLIKKDFVTQEEKARAVFRWVTTTIAYDLASGFDGRTQNAFSYTTESEKRVKERKFKIDLITKALLTKKAVCHGYAFLIEDLCQKVGLETQTIIGNLKSEPNQIGKLPNETNHAWNVIKIGDKWKFIDATLAAGFISSKTNLFKFYFNDSYFFTNPEIFFLNHYPQNERWLLVAKNKQNYSQLPIFFGSYLESKCQITKPQSGIYSNKNEVFDLAIQGLNSSHYISYSFESQNKINDIDQEDNTKDFFIPLNNIKEDYLSIYLNRKLIAIYKITN